MLYKQITRAGAESVGVGIWRRCGRVTRDGSVGINYSRTPEEKVRCQQSERWHLIAMSRGWRVGRAGDAARTGDLMTRWAV